MSHCFKRIIILFLIGPALLSCDIDYAVDNELSAGELKASGDSCMEAGNYNSAMEYYINAVKKADQNMEEDISAAALCNIGIIYATFLDDEQSVHYFEKALDKAFSIGDRRLVSVCSTNLMLSALNRRDTTELHKWKDLKKRYPLEFEDYDLFWDCYISALQSISARKTEEAREYLNRASEIAGRNDWDREHSNMLLVDIGNIWHAENNIDSALHYYNKALQANRGLHNQERAIYRQLSSVYRETGQNDSLAKYQTLLLSLMDTVYDSNRFHTNNHHLMAYGEEIYRSNLSQANRRSVVLFGVCLFFLVLLIAILLLYRKLRRARRVLLEQNESLLNENEDCKKWRERFYTLEDELNSLREKMDSQDSEKIACEEQEVNAEQYPDRRLDADQRQRIDVGIMRLIDDGKTLFDPNLTINSVASVLKVNSKYVSWTINEIYHVNFRTFIAKHRIKEACRRLADVKYDNITIAAIAEECGFKSVNNFIVVFKKETGVTPKIYRDSAHSNRFNRSDTNE